MLEISRLAVDYGAVPGVEEIDLNVQQGEIVSLVGANGAGKSTTLKAVFGLEKVRSGDITLDGKSIIGMPPESRVRLGMALVPEGRRLFPGLTVEENLLLGSLPSKSPSQRKSAVEWGLEAFPKLRQLFKTPTSKLSGGEQQMVAIARAMASSPQLIALDEPSLGLSPQMTDTVFTALETLRSSKTTVLLVEQNAARAAQLADRTYVLRNGRTTSMLRRDEISDVLSFASAYLGG